MIGNNIDKDLDDITKRNLLVNPWVLPKNNAFHFSLHMKIGIERKMLCEP